MLMRACSDGVPLFPRLHYSHSSKLVSPRSLLSKRLEQGNITLELTLIGVDKTLRADAGESIGRERMMR